jgi:hypothetical protein
MRAILLIVLATVAALQILLLFPNEISEPAQAAPVPVSRETAPAPEEKGPVCTEDCPLIDPETAPGSHHDARGIESTLYSIGRGMGLPDAKIAEIAGTIGGDPGNPLCPNGESGWNPEAVGDGGTSIGLVQIHLPAHPDVTREQALDPDFALTFIVDKFLNGEEHLWTCWRAIYATR